MNGDNSPTRLTDPDDIFGRRDQNGDDDADQPTRYTPAGDARVGEDESHLGATQIAGSSSVAGASEDDEPEDPPIDQGQGDDSIVPGYRVVEKLGEGGMGVVYKAIQSSLNRTVALKIVKRALSVQADFVKRFRREALAAAKLNHPNIVSIYDYGVANNVAYMALEYVEGRNCQSAARKAPMSVDLALRVIRDCTLGLSHAHSHGLIHRDIKPANIMLVEKGAQDARGQSGVTAKVLDLGLAKNDKSENPELRRVTQIGMVLGTPEHMAPEQALGHDIDFRCDIYALGSSLYYMLTTRLPFTGNTAIELMNKKINGEAINPQDLVPDVEDDLVRVMDRMMAKRPTERYASYEELLSDLELLLQTEPPKCQPVPKNDSSIAPRLRSRRLSSGKPKKPNARQKKEKERRLVLLGALIVLLLVGAGVIYMATRPPGGGPEFVAPGADVIAGHVRELSELYEKSDYEALSSRLNTAAEPWRNADRPLPPELQRFSEIVSAAMTQNAGAQENALRRQLQDTRDPAVIVELLKDFDTRFPFSPAREEMQRLAAEAHNQVSRLRETADKEQNVAKFIETLRSMNPEILANDYKNQKSALDKILAEPLLNDEFRAARRTEFESASLALLTRHAEAKVSELTTLWKDGRYPEMEPQVQKLVAIFESLGQPVPENLAQIAGFVGLAMKDGAGAKERDVWNAVRAKRQDPVALANLLANFETRFPFSPVAAEAQSIRLEAEANAPILEIQTEPSGATLKVDGQEVGKTMWSGRTLKDQKVILSLNLAGHQELTLPLTNTGSRSYLFRLSPLPGRELKRRDVRRNVALALKPLPEWTSVGIWTQPDNGNLAAVWQGESTDETWVSTYVDTDTIRQKPAIFRDQPAGWVFKVFFDRSAGTSEVRVLHDDAGNVAVFGQDDSGFYIGTRNLKTGVLTTWTLSSDIRKKETTIGIEWHGDVVRFILDFETRQSTILGAIKPTWAPTHLDRVEFAVKNGTNRFGDGLLYPMYAE